MRRTALCAFAVLVTLACDSRVPSGPDGSVPGLELGEACTDATECGSGVCVGTSGARGVCSRECLARSDCPLGENWACLQPAERSDLRVCACTSDDDTEVCGDGRDNDCNGLMDDCLTCGDRIVRGDDDAHCGGCFNACAADEQCRGGACRCAERTDTVCGVTCVSTATDVAHCGGCDNACATGDRCVDGRCVCPTDRPERCAAGCVDFASDESHCGGCGNACAPGLACVGGTCACTSDRPDRCGDECVDTETDGPHCGGCGNTCPAGLVCRAGACECTATTVSDFCEGVGCVDFTTDPANCGGCGNACPSGLVCRDGACACSSIGVPDYCEGAGCVSLETDPANCGACGNACGPGLVCRAGACACSSTSSLLCDGACVNTQSSSLHCGGCGVACRVGETCRFGSCTCLGLVCDAGCVPVSTSNCGGCGVTCGPEQSCSSGSCRCSLSSETACADGCHNLTNDPANCGACGNVCPVGQLCSGSACRCATGQTWCTDLGRCVNLSSDATSCGACGNACSGDQICQFGTCRCSSSSQRYCASVGACLDVTANNAHCGACDNACVAGTVCSSSTCRCPLSSQVYCTSASGCIDTRTDSAHCGRCDNACPTGTMCSASSCVCAISGETPCSTGCTDLTTDEANCGACGTTCGAGTECRSGACVCFPPVPSSDRRLTNALADTDAVRLSAGATHVGMVYIDHRAGAPNAYFQRLDASGAPAGGEVALTSFTSATGGLVNSADITWTGTEWGVIWSQSVYGTPPAQERLVLQRVAQDGTLVGAPAVTDAVDELGTVLRARSLVLLHTATAGFAVMYGISPHGSFYDKRLIRILGDGTAPSAPVQLAESAPNADAVVGPSDTFGVVFDGLPGMFFRRVEADGSVVSPPVAVFTRSGSAFADVTLAYDGSQYVFAWREEDYVGSSSYDHRISIARGTGATAPSEAAVVRTTSRVTGDAHPVRHPRISVRDGIVLLTWQQVTTGGSSFRLDAQRYSVGATGAMRALEPATTAQPLAVAAHQVHDVVWTSATTAVLGWADTRWGDTEIYDLGLTLAACGP